MVNEEPALADDDRAHPRIIAISFTSAKKCVVIDHASLKVDATFRN